MASTRSLSKVVKLLKAGQVHDNTAKNILYINFNSHTATVDYERNGDIYDLVHTDIPKELQGRGMGTIFAERIFDYLVANKKKMKLTCDFLSKFYSRNVNKYKDYVIEK